MGRRHGLLALAGLLAALLCTPASAQDSLKVMLNDVAPYSWREGPKLRGMHPSIMRALSEESGIPFEYSSGLYARVSKALVDRVADVVVTLAGPDQEAQGLFIGTAHPVRYLVISRADAPIREVAQLKGKTLGVARGAYYSAAINDDDEIRKYGIIDPFQGLRMLAVSRLDAVVSSDYLLTRAVQEVRRDGVEFATPFQVGVGAYTVYVRRDLPEPLVRRLRAALAQLQRSGRIGAILKDYN